MLQARIKKIMQVDEDVGKVAATVPVIICIFSPASSVQLSRSFNCLLTRYNEQCFVQELLTSCCRCFTDDDDDDDDDDDNDDDNLLAAAAAVMHVTDDC